MMKIAIDQAAVNRVIKALGDNGKNYPREIATAINATAKKVRFEASKILKQELMVPSKILKKVIKQKSKATSDGLKATIGLWEGYPIPLKYFGAKSIVKKRKGKKFYYGVTYKINPKHGVRSVLRDAFIVKQYGGNVFLRQEGEKRYPLRRQNGPAPGDVYATTDLVSKVVKIARETLPKEIEDRIRFLNLKATGQLRGKQK